MPCPLLQRDHLSFNLSSYIRSERIKNSRLKQTSKILRSPTTLRLHRCILVMLNAIFPNTFLFYGLTNNLRTKKCIYFVFSSFRSGFPFLWLCCCLSLRETHQCDTRNYNTTPIFNSNFNYFPDISFTLRWKTLVFWTKETGLDLS